jgi:hypothetical protein
MNNINTAVKVTGIVEARFYDQSTLSQYQQWVNKAILKIRNAVPKIMKFYQLGELKNADIHQNVICNAGFNAVAKLLTGDVTYTGEINKMALGTGTTGSASATDTELETETYRNDTASGTDDENIAYVTAYFTEGEVNGTFTEFGNFIDGTGTADTGQLWTHLKGLNWVKDGLTVLVISCKYTFASV